jgi:hypothetical protein
LNIIREDEFLEKFQQAMDSEMLQTGAKARRTVELIEDLFARSWLYCRHVAMIVDCFAKYGYYKQTRYFGTYRVDMIIGLFSRILDLHNFELVVS